MLGPDHVEVTKRCAELESLRQQRPLHTRVLDGQRRIEKATEKVEMRRKELAEAEELLRTAHEKRDDAFRECEAAQMEVLHAREGQEELVGELRGADAQPGHAGQCLLGVWDALDRLFQRASGDEAGMGTKQLVEMAKNELAALEYSLKSSRCDAGAEQEVMDAASEPGTDDIEAWTNDVVDVVGEESREMVRSMDHEAHWRVWVAAGAEEGQTCLPGRTSRGCEVLKHAGWLVVSTCRRSLKC